MSCPSMPLSQLVRLEDKHEDKTANCWPRRNEGMAAKFGDGVRRTINSVRWWCWQRQQLKELMKTSGRSTHATS